MPLLSIRYALLGVLSFALLSAPAVAQTVYYVDQSAGGTGSGASWSNAFTDLQDALAVAAAGDEVRVAEGTYTPSATGDRSASFEIDNGVRVLGGYPSGGGPRDPPLNETTLSGDLSGDDNGAADSLGIDENSYHVVRMDLECTNAQPDPAVFDGFTVTGGNADGSGNDLNGGGLLYLPGSQDIIACRPTLRNLIFVGNRAASSGGAVRLDGSGMFYPGTVLFENVLFSRNTAGTAGGGAVDATGIIASRLFFTEAVFEHNTSDRNGGAVRLFPIGFAETNTVFTNTAFYGNRAAQDGGAVQIFGFDLGQPGVEFINTVFSGNRAFDDGGAVYVVGQTGAGDVLFSNVTFAGNVASDTGGGVFVSGGIGDGTTAVFNNSILWDNRASEGTGVFVMGPANVEATFRHSLVQEAVATFASVVTDAGGNFVADPLFADADGADDTVGTADDDLTLLAASPAVDEGDRTILPDDTADLDGDGNTSEPLPLDLAGGSRVDGLEVDLGAYERPAAGLLARAELQGDPVTVGATGGALTYRVTLANETSSARTVDAWAMVRLPNGALFGPVEGPRTVTLPAGRTVGPVALSASVPGGIAWGEYTVLVRLGDFPDAVEAQGAFSFDKAGAARSAATTPERWQTTGGLDALATATLETQAAAEALPAEVTLAPAFPNPFARTATLSFALPEAAEVRLVVYDVLGRAVAKLADGTWEAGRHQVALDGRGLAGGTYLVRLEAGGQVATQRLTLLK